MDDSASLDTLFREAAGAIDAGDTGALERLLAAHPALVRERLTAPGDWLRDRVNGALEGYFRAPYLLWFVADNPIRIGSLPANIAEVARTIATAAKREEAPELQAQLDYALALVVTGRVPRDCGMQTELMDALIDAGANPGDGYGALSARNLAAAAHLVERGGRLTLAAALCLDRADDAARLAADATAEDRQIAFAAAALNGNAGALATLIGLGADVRAYATAIHPHATPLHHAVDSGSLGAVKVLVEAGAPLDARDRVYDGTPLDWAEHLGRGEIARCLRELAAKSVEDGDG
ncbi:ankyrin repeat domain-containing protein [Longimicrobium sp.]|uniref:ankyrin repeat domain-containing protein n=1 Tax=Longimicrobium sp. TaxID=2029185 RepID=UPI002CC80C0C|nr:ankyrin repeat domain-containing protein [Longimicrobium sp.]HSU16110.1 ankyrin repeat domain-containing protein [Longimicrobium sp.]